MEKGLDFFEFWILVWKKKILVIFLSILFLCIGFVANYYIEFPSKYRSYIIFETITPTQALPLLKITSNLKSSIYQQFFLFERIINNNVELANFNMNLERAHYLDNFIKPNNLLVEYYNQLKSIDLRVEALSEIEFIEKENMSNEEYANALLEIATSDDFTTELLTEPKPYKIQLEKGFKYVGNNKSKLERLSILLSQKANAKVNMLLRDSIEEIIKHNEYATKMEQRILKKEIESSISVFLDEESKLKARKYIENNQLIKIIDIIGEYQKKAYSSEDPEKFLNIYVLNDIIQKTIYLDENLRNFWTQALKDSYLSSGVKDLKFQVSCCFNPTENSSASLNIIEIKKYKPNFTIIGVIFGFVLSIILIVIQSSYKEFRRIQKIDKS